MGGHKTPIMHGLCTLGFSVRAVIATYADNDASLFKAVKARFAKPSIPGQTLKIQMWQNGSRIHFKTSIVETDTDVITGKINILIFYYSKNYIKKITFRCLRRFEES